MVGVEAWGRHKLAFARSNMGSLIEAVSRSAKERRSKSGSLCCERSGAPMKGLMGRTTLKCNFEI